MISSTFRSRVPPIVYQLRFFFFFLTGSPPGPYNMADSIEGLSFP